MKARPNFSGLTGQHTGSQSPSRSRDFGQRQLAVSLNEQRTAFKAFLVARVGSAAEDILQNGLLKALKRADELQDDAKLTAWFYQVLRNAVIDHYRSHAAGRRRNDAFGTTIAALGEDLAAAPPGWEAQLCTCLGSVVDTLKPVHAELLRRVDLNGESVQAAAKALQITPNSASVTLHRARKDLREKLQTFCGACADGACLDCDCVPGKRQEV
ncbi:MAG: sigma-70 family RNA polymerase sigma factor [bacterium]|nr:sigma-70 family RNA polymerase sigma factor [bacterium]